MKIEIPGRRVLTQAPQLSAPGLGFGQIGQAIETAGKNLAAVESAYDEKVRQAQITTTVSERFTKAVQEYNTWNAERTKLTDRHSTLVQDHTTKRKELREKYLKDVEDVETKTRLTTRLDSFFANAHSSAVSTARRQQLFVIGKKAELDAENRAELAINARDPNYLKQLIEEQKNNVAELVKSGYYTKAQGELKLKRFSATVQTGRIFRMIQTDPVKAEAMLKNNPQIEGIDPKQHIQLKRLAHSLAAQDRQANMAATLDLAKSNISSISSSGVQVAGAEKIEANLNPTQVRWYRQAKSDAHQWYDDNKILRTGNIVAINNLIKLRTPKAGDPQHARKLAYATRLQRQALAIDNERRNDPAKFYNEHPSLKRIDQAAVETSQAIGATMSRIPLEAIGKNESEARRDAMVSLQISQDISPNKVSLLTKSNAISRVNTYNNLPVTKRIDFFVSLREEFGKHYPIVFRDLVRHGKLPVEANLFNLYATTQTGLTLGPTLAAVMSKTPKEYGDFRATMTKQTRDDIKARVTQYMEPYKKSIGAVDMFGVTSSAYQGIHNAIEKMVTLEVGLGKGAPSEVAKRIISQTFDKDAGGAYTFLEGNYQLFVTKGGGFSVLGGTRAVFAPISGRVPAKYDAGEAVEAAVRANQSPAMKSAGVVVPPEVEKRFASKSEARAWYYEAIQRRGKWVTRPDDSGMWLINNAGGWVLFRDPADGKLKRYGFDFDGMGGGSK